MCIVEKSDIITWYSYSYWLTCLWATKHAVHILPIVFPFSWLFTLCRMLSRISNTDKKKKGKNEMFIYLFYINEQCFFILFARFSLFSPMYNIESFCFYHHNTLPDFFFEEMEKKKEIPCQAISLSLLKALSFHGRFSFRCENWVERKV